MSPISRLFVACGLATGLISVSRAAEPVQHHFGDWTVTIQPGVRGSGLRDSSSSPIRLVSQTDGPPADATEIPPAPSPENLPNPVVINPPPGCTSCQSPMLVQSYSQVYNSIPFSRAEYEANPSYRHDATMEFLFGQMRQTVIQRGTTVIRNQNSAMPYSSIPYGYSMPYSPYGFNSYFYPFYNVPIYRPYNLW